jgi:GMP synthase-like glutamine amidotransferase
MRQRMRIHIFQHVPFETEGMILYWANDRGHSITYTRFYELGAVIPPPESYEMLIVMGGPMSLHDEVQYSWLADEKLHLREAINANKIVLGICLGAQLIASALGAKVYQNPVKEIGWFPVATEDAAIGHPLLARLNSAMNVFHWHGETFDLPIGALHLMSSAVCQNQAFLYGNCVLALQFHLEMDEKEIEQIIHHCSHEIVPCDSAQPINAIRQGYSYITACKRALIHLLDALVQR